MKHKLYKTNDLTVEKKQFVKGFTKTENFIERFYLHLNIKSGYGSCRSCTCRGYISKHNGTHECKICGHHYDRHRD